MVGAVASSDLIFAHGLPWAIPDPPGTGAQRTRRYDGRPVPCRAVFRVSMKAITSEARRSGCSHRTRWPLEVARGPGKNEASDAVGAAERHFRRSGGGAARHVRQGYIGREVNLADVFALVHEPTLATLDSVAQMSATHSLASARG